ncbi:unnamed protein product [Sphagnum troendelagicum]|uniref:Uncharacterized protein n=1 Tax=Sphagnum troendelagicum TaxID=128251 RepID=A0ABP0USY4_9BRYO
MGGTKTLATFVAAVAVAVCAAPFVLVDPTFISVAVTVGAGKAAATAFGVVVASLTGKAVVKGYHLTEDVLEKALGIHLTHYVDRACGLEDESEFELLLRALTEDELRERYQSESYKLGRAYVGVFIKGLLIGVLPHKALGATLELSKVYQCRRTRERIQQVAQASLSKGRISDVALGAMCSIPKTAMIALFDDELEMLGVW